MLQLWLDGYQGRGLDVKKILGGYKSVTDWPAADFYQVFLCKKQPFCLLIADKMMQVFFAFIGLFVSHVRPMVCARYDRSVF